MHIADGILTPPILITGAALATAGVAVGLQRMKPDDVPKTALMASTFFVASLIHVPVGIASAHLILTGLMGVLLGWLVFPAVLIALVMQLLLLGFGGVTTLGVNLLIFAVPGLALHFLARRFLRPGQRGASIVAALLGGGGIIGSAAVVVLALAASGREYLPAAALLAGAHVPIMFIESVVTAAALMTVLRLRPELLQTSRPA